VNAVAADVLVVPMTWRGFAHGEMARAIATDTGCRVVEVNLEASPAGGLRLPLGDPAGLPEVAGRADGTRWIYFTSGTTAAPKGVRHSDETVIASSSGMTDGLGIADGDIYPIAWPISHIGGITMLTSVLRAGGTLVLFEAFDPATIGERMAAFAPTILGTGLPFFRAYLAAQAAHGSEKLFPHLRACVGGGAPTPPALHEDVKRELGGIGIVGSWGLTEFPIATCGAVTDTDEQLATSEGTAGPGVEVRVVGLDGLDKGPGEEGELRLRGPQLFRGYANPALNDGALDEQGYFHTGDLGVVTETGHVMITGRVKDIIIRNAENISASEIEDALHLHPKIADVAVIALPDDRTGERACAVVKLAAGVESITLVEIGDHCRELGLARQKVPEQLELVDEVPRNAMGKIQKPELKKRFGAPA